MNSAQSLPTVFCTNDEPHEAHSHINGGPQGGCGLPEWCPGVAAYQCEDCHEEAVFLHRYQPLNEEPPVEYRFCDKHSLAELRSDLARLQRRDKPHPWVNDMIEVVWIG